MAETKEGLLPREEVFKRLKNGKPVDPSQMFCSLSTYSPTGKTRELPMSHKNMIRFVKFLEYRRAKNPDLEFNDNTIRVM